MAAWYNENDAFAADWLEKLIEAGLIAPGVVDRRSLLDVTPNDLAGFTQCHFFAGIGGWSRALRRAGVPDHRPVWTGSCPCQPFSLAGKRVGFADDRHLWPYWRYLIAQRRPARIFGEQVASATEWLRVVRSDLEALGYAVGAIPFQAASAGADHLRDRYGFVADDGSGRRLGPREGQAEQSGRAEAVSASHTGIVLAGAYDARPQGRVVLPERAGERVAGPDGLEHAAGFGRGEGRPEYEFRSGRPAAPGASVSVDAASKSEREQDDEGHAIAVGGQARPIPGGAGNYEWVLGADGKARRVKSGIRLLVDAVSGRVAVRRPAEQGSAEVQEEHWYSRIGALKGFGNAIDPEAFAQFIAAADEAVGDIS